MPTDLPYTISDLARLTGLNVRTIRYYLAQGLIPASGESGPGAHYGEGHLDRLRLTKRLQQQHLPLSEIRTRLGTLSDTEVEQLVHEGANAFEPAPDTSALDYIRDVLAGSPTRPTQSTQPGRQPPPPPLPSAAPPPVRNAPSGAPPRLMAAMPAMRDRLAEAPAPVRRLAVSEPATTTISEPNATNVTEPATASAAPEFLPPPIERSQWERLSLGPNLELHIRRPLGRLEQKRVDRLITIAREVLKEEQP